MHTLQESNTLIKIYAQSPITKSTIRRNTPTKNRFPNEHHKNQYASGILRFLKSNVPCAISSVHIPYELIKSQQSSYKNA